MSLPSDHRLFERLYEERAAELLRYLLRRTGDVAPAEDSWRSSS
jgi:DNA-directed RNA polymerase specialized sigma24 family protein